jgi:hypothetical protein
MSFFSSLLGSKQQHSEEGGASTPLDLVTYVSGLASNQLEIGQILDTVREITATLKPSERPSSQDDKRLLGVYLQLEQYLTTKEPLRTFTKEELRKRISEPLLAELIRHEANQQTINTKA